MTFSDADAAAAWDAGARAFDAFIESGADYYRIEVHGPALLEACGRLDGARVLDLGCGQGYFSRQLASRGATVEGVDLSGALLALAERHEASTPRGIRFHRLSASQIGTRWPAGSFDVVTACMSMQDMADAAGAIRGARMVLRPGGRLVFSVPHPATDTLVREWDRDAQRRKLALKLDRYFDSGPSICHWNMPRLVAHWSTHGWRRTLGDWTRMVLDAGFEIRGLHEPRPTAAQVAANPNLEDCSRMPYFLIFDLARD